MPRFDHSESLETVIQRLAGFEVSPSIPDRPIGHAVAVHRTRADEGALGGGDRIQRGRDRGFDCGRFDGGRLDDGWFGGGWFRGAGRLSARDRARYTEGGKQG